MKVKVIDIDELSKYSDFEKIINDFIKDKQVIDIKYQSNVSMAASQGINGNCQIFCVNRSFS